MEICLGKNENSFLDTIVRLVEIYPPFVD